MASLNHLNVEISSPWTLWTWDTQDLPALSQLTLSIKDQQSGEQLLYDLHHRSQKLLKLAPGDYLAELCKKPYLHITSESQLRHAPSLRWKISSPKFIELFLEKGYLKKLRYDHPEIFSPESYLELELLTEKNSKPSLKKIYQLDRLLIPHDTKELYLWSHLGDQKHRLLTIKLTYHPLQKLCQKQILVPAPKQALQLLPSIHSNQGGYCLKAHALMELNQNHTWVLQLLKEGEVFQEDPLPQSQEFIYKDLDSGNYQVKLLLQSKKRATKVLKSVPIHLPPLQERIRMLGISPQLAYVYWQWTPQDTLDFLAKKAPEKRWHFTLKIEKAFAGKNWKFTEHDIDLRTTHEYYIKLDPDQSYQASLIAYDPYGKAHPLTEPSAICQLGRLNAGGNKISFTGHRPSFEHPSVSASSPDEQGFLMIHLHAHLPYLPDTISWQNYPHQDWQPQAHPQEWFCEAVVNTHLPLLQVFHQLHQEGVPFKLSLNLSPTLVSMMQSQRHCDDILTYIDQLIHLTEQEEGYLRKEKPYYLPALTYHQESLRSKRELFLHYKGDLCAAYAHFQELGMLELSTCLGTHVMAPLWHDDLSLLDSQLQASCEQHERVFQRKPLGCWLPECSYSPGVEKVFQKHGIHYSFLENTGLQQADAPAALGVHAPIWSKGYPVAFFGRDFDAALEVWSADRGFPGDPAYLDFHIRGGIFRYNRVTDRKSGHKQPYDPKQAQQRAAEHALYFLQHRLGRIEYLRKHTWKRPLIVAPFDAELFGHHWHEGPQFLYYLFKKIHFDQKMLALTTPSSYLYHHHFHQDAYPNLSSWGEQGTFQKWITAGNSWFYRYQEQLSRKFQQVRKQLRNPDELTLRFLKQAWRLFSCALSSDWPFIVNNGDFVDRVEAIEQECLEESFRILGWLEKGENLEEHLPYLKALEYRYQLFPKLNDTLFD